MDIVIGALVISLAAFLVLITWVVIWIFTLVYQGERNQWVWFVLTLIFNIVLLIYWIVWLFEPKLKRYKK